MPFSWFASTLQSRPRSSDRRKREQTRRRRIALESLEDRTLLSTFTWTGDGGGASPGWSDVNNWTVDGAVPTVAPGQYDDVVFNAGAISSTIDTNVKVQSLEISKNYSGTISIGDSASFRTRWNFVQAGGTFDTNDRDFTVGLTFQQKGGVFDAGSSDLTIGLHFFQTGGTFNAGDSTTTFTGNVGATIKGAPTFNNVVIDRNDSTSLTVDAAANVTVQGDLTIEEGIHTLNGLIKVAGDVTTNNTAVGGTGVIDLIGTSNQNIQAGTDGRLPNLTIDNSSGKVSLNSDLSLSGSWINNTTVAVKIPAATNTVSFVGGGGVVGDSYTGFQNVVINRTGALNLENDTSFNINRDLTITAAGKGINAQSGKIMVAGDLTSTASSVGGSADITMTGGGYPTIAGGDFPDGGIIISKGGGYLNAAVTSPLDGPLVINGLKGLTGELKVGGDVTTNAASIGQNTGVITLAGAGDQNIKVGTAFDQLPNVKIASTGTVKLGAAQLSLNGNWDYDSGGFDAGTSTVKFTGAGVAYVDTGSTKFNNVVVDRTNGYLYTQDAETLSADVMNVDGSLTIDGLVALQGTVNAYGDVTTNTGAVVGTGVIAFVGTGDQNIKVGTAFDQLPNVKIASTGTVKLGDAMLSVNGNWDYDKGGFDAGTSTVRFDNAGNGVALVGTGSTKFNNVIIDRPNGYLYTQDAETLSADVMNVDGSLTINGLVALLGTVNTHGDVTSTATNVIGGSGVLYMVGNNDVNLTGDQFPSGGIVINKGSSHWVYADVTTPLAGPLTIKSLSALTGTFHVAGDVTTSDTTVSGNSDGKPVLFFDGTGPQNLSAGAANAMVPGLKFNNTSTSGVTLVGSTLRVSGGWIVDAGAVDASGTSVKFMLAGGHGDRTIDTGDSAGFNNVELASGSGSVLEVTKMVVNGDLLITNVGSINAASGAITVAGNLTSTDDGTNYGAVGGSADITMVGSTDTTLTADAGDFPNGGIIIKKTGGAKVSLGANFDTGNLYGRKNVAPITVSSGTFDLGTYTLTTRGNLLVEAGATLAMAVNTSLTSPQVSIDGDATGEADCYYVVTGTIDPHGTYTLIAVTGTLTYNGVFANAANGSLSATPSGTAPGQVKITG